MHDVSRSPDLEVAVNSHSPRLWIAATWTVRHAIFQLAYPGPELRLVPRHLMGDRVNATEDRHESVLGERFVAPILLPNSAGRSHVSS